MGGGDQGAYLFDAYLLGLSSGVLTGRLFGLIRIFSAKDKVNEPFFLPVNHIYCLVLYPGIRVQLLFLAHHPLSFTSMKWGG